MFIVSCHAAASLPDSDLPSGPDGRGVDKRRRCGSNGALMCPLLPAKARERASVPPTATLVLLAAAVVASGCASFVENLRPVIYGKTAKDNYERGVRSMKGES